MAGELKDRVGDYCDSMDMTMKGVTNRLFEWFLKLPPEIKADIMHQYPDRIRPDVLRLILENALGEASALGSDDDAQASQQKPGKKRGSAG
jgi:hypothetical protein